MTKNFIGKTLGTVGSKWRDALARSIIRKKISPNILTFTGLVINLIGGALLAFGGVINNPINWIHRLAGLVILLANIFDMLDGAVARMSGNVTKFGAFSDSVMDRYSDMALFAGAIIYFALRHDMSFVIISSLALVGSVMTSYTRARAESLLPGKYNSGYMERPERIVILVATCLVNRLYMGMIFIAIFANLATFHRIWDTRQTAFNLEHPSNAGKGYGAPNSPAILRFIRSIIFWNYPRQTWQHDAMGAVFLLVILFSLFLSPR
jgi:CDP-diacylglycerol--glycerol-3-phosphate 3-phosphatidyltransferase